MLRARRLCELGDVARLSASRKAVRMAGIDIGAHRWDRRARWQAGASRPQSPESASTLTTSPRLPTIADAIAPARADARARARAGAARRATPPARPADVELAGRTRRPVAGPRRDHCARGD